MLLGFLLPIALITVFGFVMKYAFGGGGGMPRATLWIADQDAGESSRRFVDSLRQSDLLRVRPQAGESARNADDLRKLVADGESHHAQIIERGFGESLDHGSLPDLTLVRDPLRTLEDRVICVGLMQSCMEVSEGKVWPAAMGR